MGKDGVDKQARKEDPIKCRRCGETFLHQRSLIRHLAVEHGPKIYFRCRRCAHKNNRSDNLRYHYRDCHPDKVAEVADIKGETCEEIEKLERRCETGGNRRKRSPTQPKSSKEKQPKKDKPPKKETDACRKASEKPQGKKRGSSPGSSGKEDRCRSADARSQSGGEPSKKRGREEATEKRSTKKKPARPAACTVSRAPDSGSEEQVIEAPAQVEEPLQEADIPVTTQGVDQREREAHDKEVDDAAPEVQGPLPLAAEDLREMAEIELSPTPMSVCEPDDDFVDEVPRPTRGGKSIRLMQMKIGSNHGDGREEVDQQSASGARPLLRLSSILPGQAVKVREVRETYLYREESKVLRGETHREFDVVYLRPVPTEPAPPAPESRIRRIVQSTETGEERLGPSYNEEGLEQAMAGKVTRVTETSSRVVYQDDQKIMKDKTTRVYEVAFTAGVAVNK
ncbi:uncharacterized protein LOC119738591 [Patiria miniata]|uniref:C2H2-type domain-containing protein n=1 Tax=Patiria miniata TaxID=46514 RepID=A0A914B1Q2_PATMI|nr:uncharacterized protein LOC119738591 [Patiria miniata]